MVYLWFLVALVRGKTSGDGFEGVMRIESPRPSDWHAISGSMMLGHACTVQLKAQGSLSLLVTAQRAEPQSADLLGLSFVTISKSYV